MWIHDHGVHETAVNAYDGLAAQYQVIDCNNDFENSVDPKFDMAVIIGDKVFDADNQVLIDVADKHKDNLYGEIC